MGESNEELVNILSSLLRTLKSSITENASIAMQNRYIDKASPCLIPLELWTGDHPLTDTENATPDVHLLILYKSFIKAHQRENEVFPTNTIKRFLKTNFKISPLIS